MRLAFFLLIGLCLTGSQAFAQLLDGSDDSFHLADRWHQELEALDQAAKDLQKTNALLIIENARLKASIQDLDQQANSLSSDLASLNSRSKDLDASLGNHQKKMVFFLEQSESLDRQYLMLTQEKKTLKSSIDKEKEFSRKLQEVLPELRKNIEGIEKDFFVHQQKDQQLTAYFNEGQDRLEAWLKAQDQGWRQLGQDVRAINQWVLDSYLLDNCVHLEQQRLKEELSREQEKIALIEQQKKMTTASLSETGADTDPDDVSQTALEDLQGLLNAKRKEWQTMRKAPVSPEIILLKSDIENFHQINRGLREESFRLQALLKSLDRQKRSLEKTFTQR